MQDKTADFQEFLRAWGEDRPVALRFRGIAPSDREMMLRRCADELTHLARKRGFLAPLRYLAKKHGDVRGYVSSLCWSAEEQEMTLGRADAALVQSPRYMEDHGANDS